MPGVFHLCNILKLIIYGFHQGSLPKDYLVIHRHQYVLHIAFDLGNDLYPVQEEEVKKPFVYVSLISAQFTTYFFHKGSVFQRIAVISVGRCYHEVEQLSFVIDDYMELEAEEPTHRTSDTLGYSFENPVVMDSFVVANFQGS